MHGEVLRRPTTLAQSSISHEGWGLGYVYEGPGRVPGSSALEESGGGSEKIGGASQRAQHASQPGKEGTPI